MEALDQRETDRPPRGAHALVQLSETRWRILEALESRPRTVGELARRLDVNKSGVHRHVCELEAAGLIVRRNGPRKWVYNEITTDGSRLMARLRVILRVPAPFDEDASPTTMPRARTR